MHQLFHALALLALVSSVLLMLHLRGRVTVVVALVVSALQVLRAFGVLHLEIRHVPLELVLGAGLLVTGVLMYFQSSAKPAVAAATCVGLVGLLEVVTATRLLG